MDIGALLKSYIYLIASSLLYPVLFVLVVLIFWILIYSGSFFAEWLERIRLDKNEPQKLPELIRKENEKSHLPHRVNSFINQLKNLLSKSSQIVESEVENLLQENTLLSLKSIDRLKMIVRIGPGLGLIGTLIPMGTGLAALGQGDITKLSSDLVIAFTTTVVGMASGLVAYFFYTIKKRWIAEDIKNIELAAEILTAQHENQA